MKPSKYLLKADNCQNVETPAKGIKRGVVKSLFFMFLLSSVMLFSSCYATVRTPRYERPRRNVVIVGSEQNYRHDNGNHYGQYKHKKPKGRDRDDD
jgi:hypothetical protein